MHISINPNKEYAEEIKRKLRDNGGFCPCSLVKNEDTRCICKEFREQVERNESGYCYCGLWYAEQKEESIDEQSR